MKKKYICIYIYKENVTCYLRADVIRLFCDYIVLTKVLYIKSSPQWNNCHFHSLPPPHCTGLVFLFCIICVTYPVEKVPACSTQNTIFCCRTCLHFFCPMGRFSENSNTYLPFNSTGKILSTDNTKHKALKS